MGKGDRRRRKAAFELPGVAPVKRPKKRGSTRMAEIRSEEVSVALKARARACGLRLAKEQTRDGQPHEANIRENQKRLAKMGAQMLGEPAGQALHIGCNANEASDLYEIWVDMTASEDRYHRSMGVSIHAKSAKIEMMPERTETRDDDRPDLRSEEERDMAAQAAWRRWDGHLNAIGLGHRSAIDTARMAFTPLFVDAKLSLAGERFIDAMRALERQLKPKERD